MKPPHRARAGTVAVWDSHNHHRARAYQRKMTVTTNGARAYQRKMTVSKLNSANAHTETTPGPAAIRYDARTTHEYVSTVWPRAHASAQTTRGNRRRTPSTQYTSIQHQTSLQRVVNWGHTAEVEPTTRIDIRRNPRNGDTTTSTIRNHSCCNSNYPHTPQTATNAYPGQRHCNSNGSTARAAQSEVDNSGQN